tara:strand:- start:265 stop:807 length:543 start_codon:yes stop_codon:yes gene_type:complete
MIDIETLDTKSSAVVIQIAAVAFSYNNKGQVEVVDQLNIKLPVAPQLNRSRTISVSTVKFWLNTPAQQQLLGELLSPETKYNYDHALVEFLEFCQNHAPTEYWSQGPTFDMIILEDMLDNVGLITPWKFYQVRDLRTVQKFVGDDAKSKKMKAENSNHNALDDCHSQIKLLQHFIKKVKK